MARIINNPEIVDVILSANAPGTRWRPSVGEETLSLLERSVPDSSRATLAREAVAILSHCVPPTSRSGQDTGLVIGHVQSGKTASFTAVAALARDNGYRLVIVLSGLTRYLFNQSKDRLEDDLRANNDRIRWLAAANPRAAEEQESILAALATSERTVLLTVMKNRSHLEQLIRLLSRLPGQGVPTIVIDDEADQASLNNEVRTGGQSATYRRLGSIRDLLPQHTYLQYTATPQAPLLINLIDVLSPQFAEVLTPGSAYTGGQVFFETSLELVRRIPASELPSRTNNLTEPPESLLSALRLFFLGVAAGRLEGKHRGNDNRSMMVHPSPRRAIHLIYHQWVQQIKTQWTSILAIGEVNGTDPDYIELTADFSHAYDDLKPTLNNLHDFEEVMREMKDAISQTIPRVVHSGSSQIDWRQQYAWILVGGEVLNRGFTIRGLTVTYMPRSLGTGQADTIQQRARWFGYKEDYLEYCRVYLSDPAIQIYKSYVDHEEQMRDDLREFSATGRPLAEWKRRFFLSPQLIPTRHAVLDQDYERGNYANTWFVPTAPHDRDDAIATNRESVAELTRRFGDRFRPDDGHPGRTDDQHHLVASGLSLRQIYEDFLTKLIFTRSGDSARFTGLLLQIARHLEDHPGDTCTIYQMKSGGTRRRRLGGQDEIEQLFQGQNPDGVPRSAAVYPGDREIHAQDELTIQLHRLNLTRDGTIAVNDVPAAAVWVPRRMSAPWISQHQEK